MKKILITGGAGFIGSYLVNALKDNYEVFVLDNLDPQIHGSDGHSYTYNLIKDNCHFILGDVTNPKDWEKVLSNDINIVVHLAAQTGTGQSMYEATSYVNSNCIGTTILGDCLSNYKSIEKIVLASSRSIYGEGKYINRKGNVIYPEGREIDDLKKGIFECLDPIDNSELIVQATDENSGINPISTYAITKYFQEIYLKNVCEANNVSFFGLRFQNVYGPGQSLKNPYTGIISIFSSRILQGKDIFIFEDGKESRDFVYCLDVLDAVVKAIEFDKTSQHILNIGSGTPTTVLEIANVLKEFIGNDTSNIIVNGEYRKGDIRHNFADISKAENILNYKPKYSINEGLRIFVEWLKTQELGVDLYEKSLQELKNKGLLN